MPHCALIERVIRTMFSSSREGAAAAAVAIASVAISSLRCNNFTVRLPAHTLILPRFSSLWKYEITPADILRQPRIRRPDRLAEAYAGSKPPGPRRPLQRSPGNLRGYVERSREIRSRRRSPRPEPQQPGRALFPLWKLCASRTVVPPRARSLEKHRPGIPARPPLYHNPSSHALSTIAP